MDGQGHFRRTTRGTPKRGIEAQVAPTMEMPPIGTMSLNALSTLQHGTRTKLSISLEHQGFSQHHCDISTCQLGLWGCQIQGDKNINMTFLKGLAPDGLQSSCTTWNQEPLCATLESGFLFCHIEPKIALSHLESRISLRHMALRVLCAIPYPCNSPQHQSPRPPWHAETSWARTEFGVN